MANLANSCEHLNIDKICAVFNDNPKAKANRQLNCKSDKITSCCYLCNFRLQCATSCKYLGQSENHPEPQYATKETHATAKEPVTETLQPDNVPDSFCVSCNADMVWAKTQFAVDNWTGNTSAMLSNDKVLPVTVFLCPRCGKIEFKAAEDAIRKEAK